MPRKPTKEKLDRLTAAVTRHVSREPWLSLEDRAAEQKRLEQEMREFLAASEAGTLVHEHDEHPLSEEEEKQRREIRAFLDQRREQILEAQAMLKEYAEDIEAPEPIRLVDPGPIRNQTKRQLRETAQRIIDQMREAEEAP